MIYISHFLEECFRVADRYTVLKDGETAGAGIMKEAGLDHLIKLMTGREVKELYPRSARTPGPPVLAVAEASAGLRLRQASLRLRAGEIFGLAGLIGAGRTELPAAPFYRLESPGARARFSSSALPPAGLPRAGPGVT